jgi:hypothetical protein
MISQLDRDLADLRQAAAAYASRHQFIPDFGYSRLLAGERGPWR